MTPLDICNSALAKLGVEPIVSLSEDSKAARLCNRQYNLIRKNVMTGHPWNFAMSRVELGLLVDVPVFDWTAQFQLPSDCLRVWYVYPKGTEFEVAGDKILLNDSSCKILYMKDITDTAKYPSHFIEALAWAMAADMAYALIQSVSATAGVITQAEKALKTARSYDGQEGRQPTLVEDVWLNSRYGGDPRSY